LRAETTSLEVSKTCGSLEGWITSLTASRLVVPIWTPMLASAKSASDVALARSELLRATTACWAS
jgi:hypothetical protein